MREPVMAPASGTQWRRERRAIGRVRGCVCRCMSLRVSPVAIDRGRKGRRRGEPWSVIELGRVWDVTREAPAFGMRVHGAWSVCWQTEEEARDRSGSEPRRREVQGRMEWSEEGTGNGQWEMYSLGKSPTEIVGKTPIGLQYSFCPTALSMYDWHLYLRQHP
jgi:hypothetical protein